MELNKIIKNKVVKSGGWYALTVLFTQGINFLTLPIFTRILSPGDFGTVALYNSWAAIFVILIGMGSTSLIQTGKHDYKEEYDSLVSSVTTLSFIIFAVYFGLYLLFRDSILRLSGLTNLLFLMMLIQSFSNYIIQITLVKLRIDYKYKLVSVVTIATNVIGVLLSIYMISYFHAIDAHLGKVIGSGLPIIITGLFFFCYLIYKGKTLFSISKWRYSLVFGSPLVIHELSGVINSQFDRIIINSYLGNEATGIYSFAYSVGMIATVFRTSMDAAWTPWFFQQMESGNYKNIIKRANNYRDLFILIYTLLIMISPELVRFAADENYWSGLDILPYIYLSNFFVFMYRFEMKIELFYKKTALLSLATLLSSGINIALNITLVPKFGVVAAGVTTLISYVFLFLFHFLFVNKVLKKRIFSMWFHMESVIFVLIINLYYVIFKENLFLRIAAFFLIMVFVIRRTQRGMSLKNET